MIDRDVWTDQAAFDALLRQPPETFRERSKLTAEIVLHLHSELSELLRTTNWRPHRKELTRENREHTLEELTDVFKLWLVLVQAWGFDPDDLRGAFYRKSAVVQQRFSEEFMQRLDAPCVIVDMDNVLCDYTIGFLEWLNWNYPEMSPRVWQLMREPRTWLDAHALGVDEQRWQEFKHHFRTSGGKRGLPLMLGARELLQKIREQGYKVIVLTSRPIDQYPNIYADTLYWLEHRGLREYVDFIWWASDKKERILAEGVRPLVKAFVDDDWKYVEPMAKLGISCYWFRPRGVEMEDADAVMQRTDLKVKVVDDLRNINP